MVSRRVLADLKPSSDLLVRMSCPKKLYDLKFALGERARRVDAAEGVPEAAAATASTTSPSRRPAAASCRTIEAACSRVRAGPVLREFEA